MNTPLSRQMDQMADAQEWKERAEQAEGQCEAVSRECIRLQEALAAEREAHAAHLAKHKTADSHDCAEMEEEYQRARAEVERLTNKLNADSQNFEIKCLSSEVERLKHLIFVWRQASYSGTPDEYQRAAVDLEDEALRISVVRAEPKHQEGSDD